VNYSDFLARKVITAPASGFDPPPLSDHLFPFQRDIVAWALRRGRAAVFADTGLGKTAVQLEWARRVAEHTGRRVLILAPLAVAKQTQREGAKFGIAVRYCRSGEDVTDGINVTNYDMLHAFDPAEFVGVVLDESSILKAYDGRTRTRIIDSFARTPYRLACTATPAPNDHTELGNHAEFLGVMTRTEMLSMFFCHDGGETQEWRLKGHARGDFWRWVASWACVIRKPSDLGYDDAAFALPPISFKHHVVPASDEHAKAMGSLFVEPAKTLCDQRAARRASLVARVRIASDLASDRHAWLVWCDLNDEGDALTNAISGAVQVAGRDSLDDKEDRLFGFSEGRYRVLVTKPSVAGFGMNWQHCARVVFVGVTHSFEQYYQAVRRVWRFGQRSPVVVHVVTSELEGAVVENLQRKESLAAELADEMVGYVRETMRREIGRTDALGRQREPYEPRMKMAVPPWLRTEDAA